MLSVCGVNCHTDCRAFERECEGCRQLAGEVAWAAFLGCRVCPIYTCVQRKGIASCGACGLAPCGVWQATRNPNLGDDAWAADIRSRLANLAAQRGSTS